MFVYCQTCIQTTDVKSKTKEFQHRFSQLLDKTKVELAVMNKSISMTRARLRMKTMPYSVKKNHYQYVRRTASRHDKRHVDLDEFFSYLDMYSCNCFEYKLLEEVIKSNNCSPALCDELSQYVSDVQTFNQSTPSAFLVHQRFNGDKGGISPPHFEHMTTLSPEGCTIADLYTFRREACYSMELPEYVLLNNSLAPGSIKVQWIFPEELRNEFVYFFCGKIGQRLLRIHQIEVMSIENDVLYKHSVSA